MDKSTSGQVASADKYTVTKLYGKQRFGMLNCGYGRDGENSVGPVRGPKGKGSNGVGVVKTQTIRVVEREEPLELDCGRKPAPINMAHETYGQLNEAGDNVVLICHALSSDAHVAGYKVEKKVPLVKTRLSSARFAPDLFAEQVIYVTSRD